MKPAVRLMSIFLALLVAPERVYAHNSPPLGQRRQAAANQQPTAALDDTPPHQPGSPPIFPERFLLGRRQGGLSLGSTARRPQQNQGPWNEPRQGLRLPHLKSYGLNFLKPIQSGVQAPKTSAPVWLKFSNLFCHRRSAAGIAEPLPSAHPCESRAPGRGTLVPIFTVYSGSTCRRTMWSPCKLQVCH
uniref:Putative secreted protein n=1 Tax=Amblyomma triste TaxID=251400 RepID=A0A023G306_AMBTT